MSEQQYQERFHGQTYRGSPVAANGRIVFTARDGTFTVLKAGESWLCSQHRTQGGPVARNAALLAVSTQQLPEQQTSTIDDSLGLVPLENDPSTEKGSSPRLGSAGGEGGGGVDGDGGVSGGGVESGGATRPRSMLVEQHGLLVTYAWRAFRLAESAARVEA